MIVLVVYCVGILADETKGDTPVATDCHCPITLAFSTEFMKTQTREIHILRTGRCLKSAQDKAQPFSMFWLNTSLGSTREEALQSLVFESYDHTYSVTWVVTGYNALTPVLLQKVASHRLEFDNELL